MDEETKDSFKLGFILLGIAAIPVIIVVFEKVEPLIQWVINLIK